MTSTYRPRNHDERAEVLRALAALLATPELDPTVRELETRLLAAARLAYQQLMEHYAERKASWLVRGDETERLDQQFDPLLGRWCRSCVDAEGRVRFAELKEAFGMAPHEVARQPEAEEVRRTEQLFVRQAQQPDLSGDPELLGQLKTTVAQLKVAVDNEEQALRAKLEAGARLAAATPAFDRAYAAFVKALQGLLGEERRRGLLPRFTRANAGTGSPNG